MEENNYFCKFVSCEPRPERWSEDALKFGDRSIKAWEVTAGGFTRVWASEKTREALWDAIKRKEVYSSSGPRMIVRFFGGYDFDPHDEDTRAPAEVGYAKGASPWRRPLAGHRRQVSDLPTCDPQGSARRQS